LFRSSISSVINTTIDTNTNDNNYTNIDTINLVYCVYANILYRPCFSITESLFWLLLLLLLLLLLILLLLLLLYTCINGYILEY